MPEEPDSWCESANQKRHVSCSRINSKLWRTFLIHTASIGDNLWWIIADKRRNLYEFCNNLTFLSYATWCQLLFSYCSHEARNSNLRWSILLRDCSSIDQKYYLSSNLSSRGDINTPLMTKKQYLNNNVDIPLLLDLLPKLESFFICQWCHEDVVKIVLWHG